MLSDQEDLMRIVKQKGKEREKGWYWKDESNRWRLLAIKLRKRRFEFFNSLLSSLPRPLQILDVGGTQEFWQKMEFIADNVNIVLYNLNSEEVSSRSFKSMTGDATDMRVFKDLAFELVFSNSVIEHVGTFEQQRRMAEEVQRIGKRYFVQTPNRFFPIEQHTLWPFFQFLPFRIQVFILTHFGSPWGYAISNKQEAQEYVKGIRLLTEKELSSLFPGALIYQEKFLGFTKSITVYKGW